MKITNFQQLLLFSKRKVIAVKTCRVVESSYIRSISSTVITEHFEHTDYFWTLLVHIWNKMSLLEEGKTFQENSKPCVMDKFPGYGKIISELFMSRNF